MAATLQGDAATLPAQVLSGAQSVYLGGLMSDAENAAEAWMLREYAANKDQHYRYEQLHNAYLAGYAAAQQWRPIEKGNADTYPKSGKPVLVLCGKHVVRAVYAPRFTLNCDEWGSFEPDGGDYDEATDSNYWPEGWYEWNEHEDMHWALDDDPTKWMPLPKPPEA